MSKKAVKMKPNVFLWSIDWKESLSGKDVTRLMQRARKAGVKKPELHDLPTYNDDKQFAVGPPGVPRTYLQELPFFGDGAEFDVEYHLDAKGELWARLISSWKDGHFFDEEVDPEAKKKVEPYLGAWTPYQTLVAAEGAHGEGMKYPRTPHLPWSSGTKDDRILPDVTRFVGQRVVVTEKLDGECTTLRQERVHARSLHTRNHPSRTWIRSFWGSLRGQLPPGLRLCGENLYARHSIAYSALTSYFQAFNAWEDDLCLSWTETLELCEILGVQPVPVLYAGPWDEERVRACWTGASTQGGLQEGYVVRVEARFRYQEFGRRVAKYVRPGHVQTDERWLTRPVVPNQLKEKRSVDQPGR